VRAVRGLAEHLGIAARALAHLLEAGYQLIHCHGRQLCILIPSGADQITLAYDGTWPERDRLYPESDGEAVE
jgi:hypothetical protein